MKIEITLTESQLQKFNELKMTREGKSDSELLSQVFDRGTYDILYRTKRNRQQWEMFKEYRNSLKSN